MSSTKKRRAAVLIILDGWGIGPGDFSNPIFSVNPENIGYLKSNFPSGALQASGISVGLPWGEEGNSEVGHLNIGTGKILYQNFPRITLAVRDGSFFKNDTVRKVFSHAQENNSSVNLIGLLTAANVHASLDHLEALIQFAEKENFPKERLNLHLITDGRDSPPESAMELIGKLPNPEQLASLAGRYYAMDRDGHWDRTELYYKTITEGGPATENFKEHVEKTYAGNLNDEYVLPTLVGSQARNIKDGDAVLFFNFREDRMRQIAGAFIEKDFDGFKTKKFSNLYLATMTPYKDEFEVAVVFPPEKSNYPLSRVLAENGKVQWRVAETEKYAHITYFFNGEVEESFKGEYRVLIPSTGLSYDKNPEMRAEEITTRLLEAIEEKTYDFILVNFANPDMVAHTGDFEATAEAVKIIDEKIGRIVKTVLANDDILIITSDHGNAERLLDPKTGEKETKHDPSPVPIYLVAKEYERKKSPVQISQSERAPIGVLSDVAPTILELMGIPKPAEMTGQSLLSQLTEDDF